MSENEISKEIVDVAFLIHKELGPGLLESVYEEIMAYELRNRGLNVVQQKPVPVIWDDVKIDLGFRADLIVENRVVVELKAVETLHKVAYRQLLTYLTVTELKLGLLINFGEQYIKDGIKRVVNKL
jgi:GxxExxY protein